jgi:hypothetical protein
MVTGMETFRRHFAGFEDSFVLIGGAACDEWFTRSGGRFRATRDIDMVLVLDAVQTSFFPHFWTFIKNGGYEIGQRADGDRTYFRFLNPTKRDYPKMVELLSTAPMEIEPFPGQHIVPISAGEDLSSLSAILMGQRDIVSGLPLIKPGGLIVLKARAWLDLTRRRAAGETTVKEDDVNKHRSDVFRLAAILPVDEHLELPEDIAEDLRAFLSAFPATSLGWRAISQSLENSGIRMAPPNLLGILKTYFHIAR